MYSSIELSGAEMYNNIKVFAAASLALTLMSTSTYANDVIHRGLDENSFDATKGSATQCVVSELSRHHLGGNRAIGYKSAIVVSEGINSVKDCFILANSLLNGGYPTSTNINNTISSRLNAVALNGVEDVVSFYCVQSQTQLEGVPLSEANIYRTCQLNN